MKKKLLIAGLLLIVCAAAAVLLLNTSSSETNSTTEPKTDQPTIRKTEPESTAPTNEKDSSFTVTFVDADDAVLQTVSVQAGESAVPPAAPIRESELFCGWSRPLTNVQSDFTAKAMYQSCTNPTIAVETVYVSEEQNTVAVNIYVLNNPGISSLMINLQYPSALRLEAIKFADEFGTYTTAAEPYTMPQTLSMISPFQDVDCSGVFATATFSIDRSALATGQTTLELTASYVQDNTFNEEYEDVTFMVVNGSATIL